MLRSRDATRGETSYGSVSGLCDDFVRKSNATCALLVGQDGLLWHRAGAVADLDLDSLSALAAGAFATGRELARLIGENTFDVAMQQGRRNHLQLIRVANCGILVAVFDDRTTAAMVRLHGRRAARRLGRVFTHAAGDSVRSLIGAPEEDADLAAEAEEEHGVPVDFVLQSEKGAAQLRAALRLRTIAFVLALTAAAITLAAFLQGH